MCKKRFLGLSCGVLLLALIMVLLLLGLAQLVPYGRDHTNPPVQQEPAWDSPQTRELAVRACYDCHSNETAWPWYTNIAPASWLAQRDVEEGRERLNFSEWGRPHGRDEEGDLAEPVQEGEMPPFQYMILHPAARLSSAEREALVRGLQAIQPGPVGQAAPAGGQ